MRHDVERTPGEEPGAGDNGVSRRSFIQTLGLSAAATSLAGRATALARAVAPKEADAPPLLGPDPIEIKLKVNGTIKTVKIDPSATLLQVLRMDLGLTGSKEVCDRGACGACSVIIDGKLIVSCMMLAVDAVGSDITTVEGLAKGDALDPVQAAFVKHDALQCGYCTPGLVVATRWLLDEVPKPTMDQIKKYLGGNICRCGTYTNIFNAALEASGQAPVMDARGA
jgi:xanthine dehydrogenase YagT iron-sulfur-binding subunit